MRKFRFSPCFFIAAAFVALICGYKSLLGAAIALLLHELGHYFVALRRGFIPESITLSPFGATMAYDDGLPEPDEFAVTVAGPATNVVFCLILAALWWFFPATYNFSRSIFTSNFALAAFNLIPVFPFDGGRLVLTAAKNKLKALKISRVVGYVLSAVMLVIGVVMLFFGYGFTLVFSAIVILWSNLFDAPKERYKLIFSSLGITRGGIYELKTVCVTKRTTVSELVRFLSKNGFRYKVFLLDGNAEIAIPNDAVENLFYLDRSLTMEQALLALDMCRGYFQRDLTA